MDYGFTITKQGWKLLAKLLTGSQLEISKVMVGSGKMPEGANPGEMTGLVQPVALATSSVPQVENEQVSFIVEYRSDLNGGLKEGFWLNEFGVFANDPDVGEVLLYYATMGDYPQYVSSFTGASVDIRRYPVSIALSEGPEVHLDYPAGALVMAEEMEEALDKRGVPSGGLEGQMLIKASNQDYATEWGPWPSNPNLLLNWDFRNPVNRNGKGEYTNGTSLLYTIDKWMLNSTGYLSLQDDSVLFHKTGTYATIWNCFLKDNPKPGNTVTFSALCKASGGAFLLAFQDDIYNTTSIPVTDEYSLVSLTKELTGNLSWIGFRDVSISNENNNLYIKAAKFEIGDQQTLAHQDADGNWVLNDPPNYDLQYALCSQYSPGTGEFVGSQHSNPNLLDNWYFADPINQRGQTEYTGTGYSIDRWYLSADSSLAITDKGITLNKILSQYVSGLDFDWLIGKNVTISMLVGNQLYSKTGTVLLVSSGAKNFASLTIDSNNWIIFGYTTNNNKYYFQFALQNLEVVAAKLELGSLQTLAHKEGDTWVLNDPAPNKASELAKCQRYQLPLQNAELRTSRITNNLVRAWFPTPVVMRTTPTIASGAFQFKPYNLSITQEDPSWSVHTQGCGIWVTGSYKNTPLTDGTIYSNNVLLDANL